MILASATRVEAMRLSGLMSALRLPVCQLSLRAERHANAARVEPGRQPAAGPGRPHARFSGRVLNRGSPTGSQFRELDAAATVLAEERSGCAGA